METTDIVGSATATVDIIIPDAHMTVRAVAEATLDLVAVVSQSLYLEFFFL
jgi:hypothetical protein